MTRMNDCSICTPFDFQNMRWQKQKYIRQLTWANLAMSCPTLVVVQRGFRVAV